MQTNPLRSIADAQALARTLGLARTDAEVLISAATGHGRAMLMAFPERELSSAQASALHALLTRRGSGEPVAYLLGYREFWSLRFKVTPAVLIPRPETELLVELALSLAEEQAPLSVLDLGTGSGAIAAALAHERPYWQVLGVDCSAAALSVAQENRESLKLDNLRLQLGSWYQSLVGQFHLIVSNPPYIAGQDPHLAQGDLRFEPGLALSSGGDGLASLREIIEGAADRLHPGGWLLLEHGYDQAAAVRALLHAAGLSEVRSAADLAGIERVSLARQPC